MTVPRSIYVDDNTEFGTYAPRPAITALIDRIRRLPTSWMGTRLMYALRRLARLWTGDCVDSELFGARMRLYCSGNASEKKALFAPQFFDQEDRQALSALAAPGAVFLDIGANVGLYSFSTAEQFKRYPHTRIVAVEPHPEIHRRLAFNRKQNPDLAIDLFQGGIADKAGSLELLTGQFNLGETRMLKTGEASAAQTITVPVITLLDLAARFDLDHIDGMKIDVEGFEEAVLLPFFADAPDALLPRLIVIEDNRDQWKADLISAAAQRGYALTNQTRMNLWLTRSP